MTRIDNPRTGPTDSADTENSGISPRRPVLSLQVASSRWC